MILNQKPPYLAEKWSTVDGSRNLLTTQDFAVSGLITSNAPASPKKHGINNNPYQQNNVPNQI